MFGELQQQQVAPSGADPESCSALHHQGLHSGPGGSRLCGQLHLAAVPASAAGVLSAGRGVINVQTQSCEKTCESPECQDSGRLEDFDSKQTRLERVCLGYSHISHSAPTLLQSMLEVAQQHGRQRSMEPEDQAVHRSEPRSPDNT